jgi:DNA polymerase-3 subunit alpha
VNKKALECMALSGALDSFGIRREQYMAPTGKYSSFIEALVVYGQNYQRVKQEAQNSLFGAFDAVEISKPKVSQAEEWSTVERLNKERELVGIYLSAHPLDDYAVVLDCMCNTHCSELGRDSDKAELAKRDVITAGGIVTAVSQRFSKNNKPFGIVTIEDFEGQGELALFDRDWAKWGGMLREGCSVMLRMKCVERFRDSGVYSLNVVNIDYLEDVNENSLTELTINLDMNALSASSEKAESDADDAIDTDDEMAADDTEEMDTATQVDANALTDLACIIKESPGKTRLLFKVHEPNVGSYPLSLASHLPGIKVNRRLVDFIRLHDKWMRFSIS